MMLAHGPMRVSHVSTHIPLAEVPARLTPQRLRRVLDLMVAHDHRRLPAPQGVREIPGGDVSRLRLDRDLETLERAIVLPSCGGATRLALDVLDALADVRLKRRSIES